ncbi:MAG: wzt, partial [Burkholderiales bacterium]|nr:wzt [Burkholderiales bacterium]
MGRDIAIKVENLTKVYKLYSAPIDRLKEALHPFKKKYHKDFHALDNVSFTIPKGECIGVLGKNGAGKSTLLKIITGVLTPTVGKVEVNGRISALLELGGGFNPEYTGIENIYFQGNILGFERENMDAKLKEILEFADIGEFIHQPVKNYSSGMFARLAFALAINIEPEILIVDEALSVGDMFFQAKCMARMKKLMENEHTTVLFVSHDISSIKAMCTSAVLLENGRIKMYDRADKVAEEYFALRFEAKSSQKRKNIQETNDNRVVDAQGSQPIIHYSDDEFKRTSSFQRIQNGKANFTNVVLLNEVGKQIHDIEFGQTVILRCFAKIHEDIHNLAFGFHVRDRNGVEVLYDDTILQHHDIISVKMAEEYVIDWTFRVLLQPNQYVFALVTSIPINLDIAEVDMCDFVPIALQFR